MSTVAFLITSAYQVYHYKQIAEHLTDTAAVIEVREKDFGLTEQFVASHMPQSEISLIAQSNLSSLDGRFELVVCQTPILPLQFLNKSLVVAQQYSLAKEVYQYGIWRSQADLNLMYGQYSADRISGFSKAVAAGNPMLDAFFSGDAPQRASFESRPERPRLLYMPTYGELSSTATVLPRLREIDAEITVKAHHAEDRGLFADLPDHISVVYAEADPVELFRRHDGVISDFSGAAFDALAVGLPTVLAGTADPAARDFARLSDEERDQGLIREVTAMWKPGEDLFSAFGEAERRLDGAAYEDLRKHLWANLGTAGQACAEEITALLEHGPAHHFASEQIRTTVRRYITSNRQLSAKHSKVVGADASKITDKAPLLSRARLGLAYRRLARLARRSELAVRLARAVRRRLRARQMNEFGIDPSIPAAPAARRDHVSSLLEPFLIEGKVRVMRDEPTAGSDIGLFHDDKKALHRALRRAAKQHHGLRVRVGHEWKIVEHLNLSELSLHDLLVADWLEIGLALEHSHYKIGYAGYAKFLFVQLDEVRNRYLATKRVANRPDWTPLVRQIEAAGPAAPVAVGEPDTHAAGPIDVVYTWVDSNDPQWQASRQKYDGSFEVHNESANNAERYIDRNELRYSLRALHLFAPFVRNIYIVTADQHPAWLASNHPQVQVVSHRDIFPDPDDLPTFNSHAIEACLHRIPGLSENFVYFNDDVFVGREVTEDDFFTLAGQVKVRLSPSQFVYEGEPEPGAIPTDWATYNSVKLLNSDFGMNPRRRVKHVPLVMKKSVMEEIEAKYPAEVKRTRAARFRSLTDIAYPSMFAQYYAMATGKAVEWPGSSKEYVYLDTGRLDSHDRLQRIMQSPSKFFCVNTTRHTEIGLAQQASNLHDFFTKAFPEPAPWEMAETTE